MGIIEPLCNVIFRQVETESHGLPIKINKKSKICTNIGKQETCQLALANINIIVKDRKYEQPNGKKIKIKKSGLSVFIS